MTLFRTEAIMFDDSGNYGWYFANGTTLVHEIHELIGKYHGTM